MSVCLAIDTATDWGSVAVGMDETPACEIILGPRRHARGLLPAIEECLRVAESDLEALAEVVIADGPGSFTGLRIGVSTVKGILTEKGPLPVAATPSLMSAAWGASVSEAPVAALYNALRGEVFAAVYSFEDQRVTVHVPPVLTTPEELRARCPVAPFIAIGDGAVAHQEIVRAWTGRPALGPPRAVPRAGDLLSLRKLDGGVVAVADFLEFEPDYGRAAEAQVKWERKHGRSLRDP